MGDTIKNNLVWLKHDNLILMCLLDKTDTPDFVPVMFWPVNQNLHKQRSVKLLKMTRISINGWHNRKTNNLIWLRHYTFILIFIFDNEKALSSL